MNERVPPSKGVSNYVDHGKLVELGEEDVVVNPLAMMVLPVCFEDPPLGTRRAKGSKNEVSTVACLPSACTARPL